MPPRRPHAVEAVFLKLPAPIDGLAVLPDTPATKAVQNLFARVHDTNARAASRLVAGGAPRETFMNTAVLQLVSGVRRWEARDCEKGPLRVLIIMP